MQMSVNLQQLLDQASHPDNPAHIRRLARNHALDLVDVQTQHPDTKTCGNQIPAGIPHWESRTYALGPLPDEPDKQPAYYDQLERVLAGLLGAQRSATPYGEPMTEQGDILLTGVTHPLLMRPDIKPDFSVCVTRYGSPRYAINPSVGARLRPSMAADALGEPYQITPLSEVVQPLSVATCRAAPGHAVRNRSLHSTGPDRIDG